MGLFGFLFGKSRHETIWTLDVYIETICNSLKDKTRNAEEQRRYLRKLGEEIGATYGITGIQHAWRAASLTKDPGPLQDILRVEWNGISGWKA